jgi:hypothetical protein
MRGARPAWLLRHSSVAALAGLTLASCGATERQLVAKGSGASCSQRREFPHVTTRDYLIVVTLSEPRLLVRGKRQVGDGELIVSGSATATPPPAFSGREVSRLHVDVAVCSRRTGVRAPLEPTLVIEDRSSHEHHTARLLPLERATGAKSFHYGSNVLLPHQPIFDLTVGGQRARLIPPNG